MNERERKQHGKLLQSPLHPLQHCALMTSLRRGATSNSCGNGGGRGGMVGGRGKRGRQGTEGWNKGGEKGGGWKRNKQERKRESEKIYREKGNERL